MQINGTPGDDILIGTDGDDLINPGTGNDSVAAGAGNDYILVGGSYQGGSDTIDGGDGRDIASYDFSGESTGVTFTSSGTGPATRTQIDPLGAVDTLTNIEAVHIFGGSGNDVLTGDAGDNYIAGNGGADSLFGGHGDDFLQGGAGNDLLDGGANGPFVDTADYTNSPSGVTADLVAGTASDGFGGTDTLIGIEGLNGSAFADTLVGNDSSNWFRPGDGNDTVNGGAGLDVVFYEDSTTGVIVNLQAGSASGAGTGIDTLTSIEAVHGSRFDDELTLSDSGGYVFGRAGDDILTGGTGNDNFIAGSGNDTIHGGAGFDNLSYTEDGFDGGLVAPTGVGVTVDLSTGTATDSWGTTDTYTGIEGVSGSRFHDTLTGDALGNALSGDAGNDTIDGLDGSDFLAGGDGADSLSGGNGNDWLQGDGGDDVMSGGDGDDVLQGGEGSDSLDGGAGAGDMASYYNSAASVVVSLSGGIQGGDADGDTFANIENIGGSAFNDTLTGNGLSNFIDGGAGDDTISGLDGNDNLQGGTGVDTLVGGNGDDVLQGGEGGDILNGGDGSGDMAGYFSSAVAVTVNLSGVGIGGDAAGDTFANIENIGGSAFSDTLTGNVLSNFIDGGAGADTIFGMDGNDNLQGGLGADFINGGIGFDSASYFSASGPVTVSLMTGLATGGAGNDTLVSIENLSGSSFGDSLTGDGGNNSLRGEAGDDSLFGEAGNDFITGGSGNDTIDGGAGTGDTADYFFSDTSAPVVVDLVAGTATGGGGNDSLTGIENVNGSSFGDTITGDAGSNFIDGRAGNDALSGGAGRDSFVGGAGNDTIDGGAILDRSNYTDLNSISYFTSTSGINLNLSSGIVLDGLGGTDTLTNINFVTGSAQGDILTGSSTSNLFEQFEGGLGNDMIDGGAIDAVLQRNSNRVSFSTAPGSVTVDLAAGTATGAAGSDTLANINHVTGGNGGDTLLGSSGRITEQFEGRAGNDTINGRGGIDIARYDSATNAVNVNLATGVASDGLGGTDTLINIEGIRGSSFNDILTGGNVANSAFEAFTGNAGNDVIDGGAGYDRADYLTATAAVTVTLGGTGNGTASDGLGGTDTLISIEGVRGSTFGDILTGSDSALFESFEGREGNDVIDGMGGIDRADYQFSEAGVTVNLKAGTASDGYGDMDSLRNIENARGSSFADVLTGGKGSNVFEGGAGNDRISGGSGQDTAIFSGAQADYTIVKHGNKVTVTGADGIDVLKSIEVLQFSDGSLTLKGKDTNGLNASEVMLDEDEDEDDWKDASGIDSWMVADAKHSDDDVRDSHGNKGGSGDGEIWSSADVAHSHAFLSASESHGNSWSGSDGTFGS